jgi:hypothetical protein
MKKLTLILLLMVSAILIQGCSTTNHAETIRHVEAMAIQSEISGKLDQVIRLLEEQKKTNMAGR